MITAYVYENRQLTVTEINTQDSIPASTIWLDLYKPDEAEREWLSRFSVEECPTKKISTRLRPRRVFIKTATAYISIRYSPSEWGKTYVG